MTDVNENDGEAKLRAWAEEEQRLRHIAEEERTKARSDAALMLALLQELIDIEGPQPGTAEWAKKVHAVIAKATGKTLSSGQRS